MDAISRARWLPLLLLAGGCATVPRYDPAPPDVRLEVRGLPAGTLVLRPGSVPLERALGPDAAVDVVAVAVDPGGLRSISLVGTIAVGCEHPDAGGRTLDVSEVRHVDTATRGPGGMVRTAGQVARTFRPSDHRVDCVVIGARPWVEVTLWAAAEDFGGWRAETAELTLWW